MSRSARPQAGQRLIRTVRNEDAVMDPPALHCEKSDALWLVGARSTSVTWLVPLELWNMHV